MSTHWQNLERHISNLKNDRILDLGCGRGDFLLQAIEQNADIQGLELNSEYIAQAQTAAAAKNVSIKIVQGKAEALPFADESFDFVNICEVIEHVENPEQMLREVYRVLSPGGSAYISVPNRFGMRDQHFHLYFVNWLPRAWSDGYIQIFGSHKSYENLKTGHQRLSDMHYYTFKKVKALAESRGFTVIDIREDRIKNEFRATKKVIASLAYPLARTIYFDAYHLILTKPLAKASKMI